MTNIRKAALAAALIAGAAGPASAHDRQPASSTRNAVASAARIDTSARADDRRICVHDSPTGSRIARLLCHSRSEWQRRYHAVPGEEG